MRSQDLRVLQILLGSFERRPGGAGCLFGRRQLREPKRQGIGGHPRPVPFRPSQVRTCPLPQHPQFRLGNGAPRLRESLLVGSAPDPEQGSFGGNLRPDSESVRRPDHLSGRLGGDGGPPRRAGGAVGADHDPMRPQLHRLHVDLGQGRLDLLRLRLRPESYQDRDGRNGQQQNRNEEKASKHQRDLIGTPSARPLPRPCESGRWLPL